jgi:hypothetical protein
LGCNPAPPDYPGRMTTAHPIDRLAGLSHTFGSGAAREKLQLLEKIARLERHTPSRLVRLHDALYFMRAYPDNDSVLRAVSSLQVSLREIVERITGGDPEHDAFVNTGLPATCNRHTYSYAVLERMVKLFPGYLDVDWSEITYEPTFVDALNLTVLPAESRGLEDEYMGLRDWLRRCKTDPRQTDLETVLRMFKGSSLSPRQRIHVFDSCEYPVVYRLSKSGSARCEVGLTPASPHYQRRPFSHARFRLKPKIVRPLDGWTRLGTTDGRKMMDLSLAALCSRKLEIHPLSHANPSDVNVAEGGRGLQIVLAGVLPEFRATVESDFFFLILKNGLPIAYGPASVFLGCCEMGINLFPEFRGGEIRYIYSQFMRALYHLLGVRYFFLTSYGMGDGNPEALKSGAFWFYRKLGFRAANPDVEELARAEEVIMRRRRGYRSSLATLRELSLTDAFFDLSGGTRSPVNFEHLSHAVSRFVREEFRGSRSRAGRASASRLLRSLEIRDFDAWTPAEKTALRRMAPVFVLVPDLDGWPPAAKRSLAAAIRAKGGPSEVEYVGLVNQVGRLHDALHALTGR